jgi:hypothetical protein
MANNFKLANAQRSALLDGAKANYNSGKLRIYDGSQPANPDTAITSQVLLAELTLNATAFGNASNGVATANAITGATAGATGTATWFRITQSNGTSVIADGSVGTSGCDLNLNSVAIQSGATVNVTSLTLTQPVP